MQAKRMPRRLAVWLVRFYQNTISNNMLHSCRFIPSCSGYAVESLERHGLIRGAWKTLGRIVRCHPLARGGYDPAGTD